MYIQADVAAIWSPLEPFHGKLENAIMPCLENEIRIWKRYIDDTVYFCKSGLNTSLINNIK